MYFPSQSIHTSIHPQSCRVIFLLFFLDLYSLFYPLGVRISQSTISLPFGLFVWVTPSSILWMVQKLLQTEMIWFSFIWSDFSLFILFWGLFVFLVLLVYIFITMSVFHISSTIIIVKKLLTNYHYRYYSPIFFHLLIRSTFSLQLRTVFFLQ